MIPLFCLHCEYYGIPFESNRKTVSWIIYLTEALSLLSRYMFNRTHAQNIHVLVLLKLLTAEFLLKETSYWCSFHSTSWQVIANLKTQKNTLGVFDCENLCHLKTIGELENAKFDLGERLGFYIFLAQLQYSCNTNMQHCSFAYESFIYIYLRGLSVQVFEKYSVQQSAILSTVYEYYNIKNLADFIRFFSERIIEITDWRDQ